MSLTQINEQISELEYFLDNNVVEIYGIIFFLLSLITIGLYLTRTKGKGILSVITFLTGALFATGLYALSDTKDKLDSLYIQKEELQSVEMQENKSIKSIFHSDLNLKSVTIEKAFDKEKIDDTYCLFKTNKQDCYFIQFLANEELMQVIVPYEKDSINDIVDGLKLKHYPLLNPEEANEYKEYLAIEYLLLETTKIQQHRFVIGSSIED